MDTEGFKFSESANVWFCQNCGAHASVNFWAEAILCEADCFWHNDKGEHHFAQLFPASDGSCVAQRYLGWNGLWDVVIYFANGDEIAIEFDATTGTVSLADVPGQEIPAPTL